MSIQGLCRFKQNTAASHLHYEKKINTMTSQKTHRLCDLRSDVSDNTDCLDMSRIETPTWSTKQFHYRLFLGSGNNSLRQTL